jgi:hypothetical protein
MGSTGTGRFTDYPGATNRPPTGGRGPSGGGGGAEGEDRCAVLIEDQLLEEVERCAYFERAGDVPPVGTDVFVLDRLVGGRLAVCARADAEVIGLLPTPLNFVRACIEVGWRYEGEVVAALREWQPLVRVTLRASR